MKEEFKRWELQQKDVEGLNAEKARDLIVRCFFEAQKETFGRAKKDLGLVSDDDQLMASVRTAVKLAFRETGNDFDRPDRQGLEKVVGVLATRAASWGTPQDIIGHHSLQIRKVLSLLPD